MCKTFVELKTPREKGDLFSVKYKKEKDAKRYVIRIEGENNNLMVPTYGPEYLMGVAYGYDPIKLSKEKALKEWGKELKDLSFSINNPIGDWEKKH